MDKKSLKIENTALSEERLLNWEKVQERLKDNMGQQIYSSWLKNIRLLKEYNHYVILGVQTRFLEIGLPLDMLIKSLMKLKSIN